MESEFDPYLILGVSSSATPVEIREAYRRLVKTMHPDLSPHDPRATRRFQQVQRAYEMLTKGGDEVRSIREYESVPTASYDCPVCGQHFTIPLAATSGVFRCPHCATEMAMPNHAHASHFAPPPPPPPPDVGYSFYPETAIEPDQFVPAEFDPNDPRYHYRRHKRNRDLEVYAPWIGWPLYLLARLINWLRP